MWEYKRETQEKAFQSGNITKKAVEKNVNVSYKKRRISPRESFSSRKHHQKTIKKKM